MTRLLVFHVAVATFAAACIVPPGDAAQIRRLEKQRAAAIARGDIKALYRLHDLDFRATCPLDRFQTPPREAAGSGDLHAIEIRGVRAWATVDGADRRAFVKDGGRWYLYEDTQACLLDSWFRVPGSEWSPHDNQEPGTRNPSPPRR